MAHTFKNSLFYTRPIFDMKTGLHENFEILEKNNCQNLFFLTWNFEFWKKNLMRQILTKSKKCQNLGPWTCPWGVLLKLVHKSHCYKLTGSSKVGSQISPLLNNKLDKRCTILTILLLLFVWIPNSLHHCDW